MNTLLLTTAAFFWILSAYYSLLTIFGIIYRAEHRTPIKLTNYPSVSVFIPAYNEEIVIASTLDAIVNLDYPGELTVYILNDNSSDRTGEIAEFYASLFPHIKHIMVPEGLPKGKARVLNYGLSISTSDYFAIYDADNQPNPDSLRLLIEHAVKTPQAVGAVGYVKTINETKNLLTRMISLEFQVFQLLMQSGRWKLFKLGSLTGTNMVVARQAVYILGGYDLNALAEDADLTLNLSAYGGLLPVVPEAITWEQEPETLAVWLRQRTRWCQGNIYILAKAFRNKKWLTNRALQFVLHQLIIYFGFATLLIISDIWLIMGLCGYINIPTKVPLLLLWFQSYLVYLAQLMSAQTVEQSISIRNVFIALIMYITYAQFFLVLVIRGVFAYIRQIRSARQPFWDKTPRF